MVTVMNLTAKIKFFSFQKNGVMGIDVCVLSPDAAVSDYLEALDEYILNGELTRLRAAANQCEGCEICCGERMPLTSVDAFILKEALAPDLTLGQFLNRYTYTAVSGRLVDIMLSRDDEDKCLLLQRQDRRCSRYPFRPLVCRTYICAQLSARAKKLRQEITNTGEDELVRLWVEGYVRGENMIHEALEADVRPEDWAVSAWTGKQSYGDVKLAEILSAQLWQRLQQGEDGHV